MTGIDIDKMQAAWDAADTSKDEYCVELEMAWPAIRDELKAWRSHPYGELKPLEWRSGNADHAETIFGKYMVWLEDDGWKYLTPPRVPYCPVRCRSREHGKSLCQADYERRVAALFKPVGG